MPVVDGHPWDVGAEPWAELRSTHSGAVLLLGDRAYKLKLPVRLGFLDFTSRASRVEACRRELALNRRIVGDVYLGTGELVGEGAAPEPLVVMRRLPAAARLGTLVERGADVSAGVERLARLLAVFHAGAARGPGIDLHGTRDAIAARWEASFVQVRRGAHPGIDDVELTEIERLTRSFLAGREALFDQRVRAGRIVDGHGDLLCEDIFCLDDGPRVLDCLDFDAALRSLDQLDDVCCLAMDLERLGAEHAARLLLERYAEHSGDPEPPALVHHFTAYRAFVRAKVGCLAGAAGDVGDVTDHVQLCLRHLRAGAVRLVLVGGPPGTGKSTLAQGLADRCGYAVVSSDRVRKELAGLDPERPAPAAFGKGLYDPASTARTYDELLRRAALLVAMGESVVLDATWADPTRRADAEALATRCGAELVAIRCVLPASTAGRRVVGRRGPSDADPYVVAQAHRRWPDWPEAHPVDTREPPGTCLARAAGLVAAGCGAPSSAGHHG